LELWENVVIITFAILLGKFIDYTERAPGYACPSYCDVRHKHYVVEDSLFNENDWVYIIYVDSTNVDSSLNFE